MTLSLFKETWLHLIRNSKNRLTIVLVFIGIIFYSGFFLTKQSVYDTIDLDQLKMSVQSNKGIMETATEKGNFNINLFTGKSAYAEGKYKYENSRALLAAIENGDVGRYIELTSVYTPDFHFEEKNKYYNENSLYPMKDWAYDSANYRNRIGSYDPDILSFHVLQEKTSWQQIQLFLHNWGPTILIVLTLFIASDVFVLGVRKRTQHIGVPIGWGHYLFTQSLAILSFVLIFFAVAALLFFIVNGLLYGFGSVSWQVPLFNYSEDYMMNPDVYSLMSIGSFLVKAVPFLLMFLYLFIRLSALLSLLFRQEVVVFVAGLFVLLFEKLYFSRTTRDIFCIDISHFPQTYFDFGKVISGEKNFMLNTPTITVNQGLIVITVTLIGVEVLLAIASYIRTRQKFIG